MPYSSAYMLIYMHILPGVYVPFLSHQTWLISAHTLRFSECHYLLNDFTALRLNHYILIYSHPLSSHITLYILEVTLVMMHGALLSLIRF